MALWLLLLFALPSPEELIRKLPTGAPVELRLHDGTKTRGWISDVGEAQFVLTTERKDHRLEKRQVTFAQVRSARQVGSVRPSHTLRNVLIGVGIGVAALLAAAVSLVASGW